MGGTLKTDGESIAAYLKGLAEKSKLETSGQEVQHVQPRLFNILTRAFREPFELHNLLEEQERLESKVGTHLADDDEPVDLSCFYYQVICTGIEALHDCETGEQTLTLMRQILSTRETPQRELPLWLKRDLRTRSYRGTLSLAPAPPWIQALVIETDKLVSDILLDKPLQEKVQMRLELFHLTLVAYCAERHLTPEAYKMIGESVGLHVDEQWTVHIRDPHS